MVRAFGLLGLGAAFLMISPKLRDGLLSLLAQGEASLIRNSPYSYVGVGAGIICLMVFAMYRGAQPR
jgi:hypothetical protein